MPLKIPNPTTDPAVWDSGINLFVEFDGYAFNHKAMGNLIARSNLMGSQGRTGEQAIAASAKAPDASRDSVPMMAKQYSQVFRAIGLFLPVEVQGKKLYMISPLLKYLVSIKDRDERISQFWKYFIRAYINPCNHLGETKSPSEIRPNVAVMRMQVDLGGGCTPYEILIGPQCQLNDDRDTQEYQTMINSIRNLRNAKTEEHLYDIIRGYQERMLAGDFGGNYNVGRKHISQGYNKKARETWNNWTRMTSAAGLNANICEKGRANTLGYDFVGQRSARMLTEEGYKFANRITNMRDLRAKDIEQWPAEIRFAMLRVVNDNLLQEWGLEIDESRMKLDLQDILSYNEEIYSLLIKDKILHTPYSEHSTQILIEANLIDNPNIIVHPFCEEKAPDLIEAPTIELKELVEFPELKPFPAKPFPWPTLTDSQILKKYVKSKDIEFATAVGKCLECLGMQWEPGRGNDVTDRNDGKVSFANNYFIPVELKSPRETKKLNLKSVRQAAENAMLAPQFAHDSDNRYKHSLATASLVIGWEFPPDRSVLENLIQRNREYWGIRIRAFVFSDLIKMARSASQGNEIDFNEILSKSGIYRWDEHE